MNNNESYYFCLKDKFFAKCYTINNIVVIRFYNGK